MTDCRVGAVRGGAKLFKLVDTVNDGRISQVTVIAVCCTHLTLMSCMLMLPRMPTLENCLPWRSPPGRFLSHQKE